MAEIDWVEIEETYRLLTNSVSWLWTNIRGRHDRDVLTEAENIISRAEHIVEEITQPIE